jgi:RNA polymerase sigma-70 factor, ECF subfamily
VTTTGTGAPGREPELLEAARDGDQDAFESLLTPYRGELHAHCYRMLGSLHDADDALQEAMLRAWRGLSRFEGRSSLRSWLYRIATNTSLTMLERRKARVLPSGHGPPTDPMDGPGEPVAESVWIEPYPDEQLGVEDGYVSPEARYERREGIELAFVAALQHLPPRQRAVLILREVLGYSAKEVAGSLETSVASVNSALQRARAAVADRVPDQSQQETLRELGDDAVRETVQRYLEAWERNDVDTVAGMLAEDASFSMPPLASWYRGREAILTWMRGWPLSGAWRWRPVPVRANGQPALAYYAWGDDEGAYLPFALNVITFDGPLIADVTAFVVRSIEADDRETYARWPEEPADTGRLEAVFSRFGLPDRLG